jgi:hypothetical protein
MADETKPAAPTAKQLPPWAISLIQIGGAALLAYLAARFGIVLPAMPAPQAAPSVLVLNVGAQPAPSAPIAVGK